MQLSTSGVVVGRIAIRRQNFLGLFFLSLGFLACERTGRLRWFGGANCTFRSRGGARGAPVIFPGNPRYAQYTLLPLNIGSTLYDHI